MSQRVMQWMAVFALVAAAGVAGFFASSFVAQPAEVKAAPTESYEYAFLLPVPRLEGYEIDLNRWASPQQDKDYLVAHVFAYEEGQNQFERRLNCLRRVNELAEKGWELTDAETGLMRRKK